MAFVHPTVTDHDADRVAPPPFLPSQAHLQSMVILALLHGFLPRHLSPLAGLLLIYLHLICVPACSARLLGFSAHTFKSSREARSTSLRSLIHHNRLVAKQHRPETEEELWI